MMLSPFEVKATRDEGYFSPETLAGGRTSTDLKDTPAAITVLNQQFIEDIAATDISQAEIWTVGALPDYDPSNAVTGSNNRGPNFSFFSRNYFLWYVKSDSFNTERFEFARGPNGVLFGDGNIGGIASTMTKQAFIGKKSAKISTRGTSWGGYRATGDFQIPVNDRFALRLNILHDRNTLWQDDSDQDRDGIHLAGTFKLTDKTQIRFEGELGDVDRQIAVGNYVENASYWNGTTTYNGVTAPSTSGTGVTRVSTSPWYVYIPNMPEAGYQNWSTFYRSTGSNIGMRDYVRTDVPVPLPLLPDREMNLMPTDARYKLKYATSTYYLEHSFSPDLFAQVAFNSTRSPYEPELSETKPSQYYIDVNTVMPNGEPNPNFGKPYTDATMTKTLQMNTVTELRAMLAYRFVTKWWKLNVNAIGGTRFDKFDYDQRRLVLTNGTNRNLNAAENEYHYRQYWDDPVGALGGVPEIPGYSFDYSKYINVIHDRKFIDYGQIATVHKFFDDRLTVFLGGRMDRVHQSQQKRIGANSVTGAPIMGATVRPNGAVGAQNVAGAKSIIKKSSNNVNYGAVYNVLPWLGVYYNFSETFGLPDSGNNLIDGTPPGVSRSMSDEFGLKFSLMRGKVYADLRYYDSRQEDALTSTNSSGQINTIWTQLGRTDLNKLAYRDTQSLELQGYEFEVVANPTRNIRLMANFTKPIEQRNVDALPGLRAYYATHLAEWSAAAETNPTIRTALETIETSLKNNTTGARVNNFTKYRVNLYANYTFHEGPLDGFAAGAGTNIVGPAKVGAGATAFDYLYSDSYYLVSANLSYSMKLSDMRLKFQLNVSNLLDEDDLVTRSFTGYRVGGLSSNPTTYVPSAFRYQNPRQFVLSATLTF